MHLHPVLPRLLRSNQTVYNVTLAPVLQYAIPHHAAICAFKMSCELGQDPLAHNQNLSLLIWRSVTWQLRNALLFFMWMELSGISVEPSSILV